MKGEYSKMNHSNLHKSGYVILIYFVMTQFVGIIGVQLLAKTGWYDIKEINSKQFSNYLFIGN